jgi:hypothetical protein
MSSGKLHLNGYNSSGLAQICSLTLMAHAVSEPSPSRCLILRRLAKAN